MSEQQPRREPSIPRILDADTSDPQAVSERQQMLYRVPGVVDEPFVLARHAPASTPGPNLKPARKATAIAARDEMMGSLAIGLWFVFFLLNTRSAAQAAQHFLAREIYESQIKNTATVLSLPVLGSIDQTAFVMALGIVIGVSVLAVFAEYFRDSDQEPLSYILIAMMLGVAGIEAFGAYHFVRGAHAPFNESGAMISAAIAGIMVILEGLTASTAWRLIVIPWREAALTKETKSTPMSRLVESAKLNQTQDASLAHHSSAGPTNGLPGAPAPVFVHNEQLHAFLEAAAEVQKDYERLRTDIEQHAGWQLARSPLPLQEILDSFKQAGDKLLADPLLIDRQAAGREGWRRDLKLPEASETDSAIWQTYSKQLGTRAEALAGLQHQLDQIKRHAQQELTHLKERLPNAGRDGGLKGWGQFNQKQFTDKLTRLKTRLTELETQIGLLKNVYGPMLTTNDNSGIGAAAVARTQLKSLEEVPIGELREALVLMNPAAKDLQGRPWLQHNGLPLKASDLHDAQGSVDGQASLLLVKLKDVQSEIEEEQSRTRNKVQQLANAVAARAISAANPSAGKVKTKDGTVASPVITPIPEGENPNLIRRRVRIEMYQLLKKYRESEEKQLRSVSDFWRPLGHLILSTRMAWMRMAVGMDRPPLALEAYKLDREEELQRLAAIAKAQGRTPLGPPNGQSKVTDVVAITAELPTK